MYDELVKRLWECVSGECWNCSQNKDSYDGQRTCADNLMKQAADAIEELQAAKCPHYIRNVHDRGDDSLCDKFVCEVKSLPRWIPVTERLPKDDAVCIITNGVSNAIGYRGKVFGWHLIWTDYLTESEVTHWMPLPSTEGLDET